MDGQTRRDERIIDKQLGTERCKFRFLQNGELEQRKEEVVVRIMGE